MNAKEYLMQVKKLDYLIKNKQDELEKLRCMTISGESYGEERISGSPNPHSQENLYIKIIEFKNQLEDDINRLLILKKEVTSMIDKLDDADEIDVLYKRYIQFQTWEQIAVDKNITIRHIYRIHGQALLSVGKILEKI